MEGTGPGAGRLSLGCRGPPLFSSLCVPEEERRIGGGVEGRKGRVGSSLGIVAQSFRMFLLAILCRRCRASGRWLDSVGS